MQNQKEPSSMIASAEPPYEDFDSFEALFAQAKEQLEYSVEGARNEFTEKIIVRMRELGISKADLADRLNAKRSFVTRLLSGNNNFTLETMVRISRALECTFRSHLAPEEREAHRGDATRTSRPTDSSTLQEADRSNFKELCQTETVKTSQNNASGLSPES